MLESIGEWHEDERHGYVEYEWDDSGMDNYYGQMKHGNKEGYGREEWNYGKVIEGQFKNNKPNGYGIWFFQEDRYHGEFKNGKFDGYGLMKYKNNDEYDG